MKYLEGLIWFESKFFFIFSNIVFLGSAPPISIQALEEKNEMSLLVFAFY